MSVTRRLLRTVYSKGTQGSSRSSEPSVNKSYYSGLNPRNSPDEPALPTHPGLVVPSTISIVVSENRANHLEPYFRLNPENRLAQKNRNKTPETTSSRPE